MSERPEPDKTGQAATPATTTTAPKPPAAEHLTTAEKAGTGTTPTPDKPKRKGTWYGNDKYPDGYTMHHEQDGSITLTHKDEGGGRWDGDLEKWVDMAGNAMPEGWGGGHKPEFREFKSGPSDKSPI